MESQSCRSYIHSSHWCCITYETHSILRLYFLFNWIFPYTKWNPYLFGSIFHTKNEFIINRIPTSIGKILINFLGSKLIYRPADNRNILNISVVSVVLFLFLKYVYRNRIAMTKKIHPITRVIVVNMETLNMHKIKPDRMHRIADDIASVFVSFI